MHIGPGLLLGQGTAVSEIPEQKKLIPGFHLSARLRIFTAEIEFYPADAMRTG
jgi:hypothetical protein